MKETTIEEMETWARRNSDGSSSWRPHSAALWLEVRFDGETLSFKYFYDNKSIVRTDAVYVLNRRGGKVVLPSKQNTQSKHL